MDPIIKNIVDELFKNGNGEQADTLRLFTYDGKYLGGWCKVAIVGIIKKHLKTKKRAK